MLPSIPEIRHYGYRRVHTRNVEFHRPYPKKRCAVTVAVVTRIDARQYPKSSKVWKYNMHHVKGGLGAYQYRSAPPIMIMVAVSAHLSHLYHLKGHTLIA